MNQNDIKRQAQRRKERGVTKGARERNPKGPKAWTRWAAQRVKGKPRIITARDRRRYVVDPVTAQWWHEGKWNARNRA